MATYDRHKMVVGSKLEVPEFYKKEMGNGTHIV